MFNAKLSTVRNMKRLRICVLVSVCPSGSVTLFSASFSALALGSGRTFWTWGVPHVTASRPGINLLPVFPAVRTLLLSMFQSVHPVTRSISPRTILESCALNVGLPSGFLAVIIWAGVAAPLPLLPPLPLPRPVHLSSVVARILCPLGGTLRCTDVGSTVGRFFRGFDKWCCLLWRLLRRDWLWTEYKLVVLQGVV